MRREFERYGVARYRALVGWLEIAGGLGLLAGYEIPVLGRVAAAGLVALMILGVGLRLRIKDSFRQTVPALVYLLLNTYLLVAGF